MAFRVKVGRPLHDNEFGWIDEIANERFEALDDAYQFVRDHIARGFRANVYDGGIHIGTFEEN